MPPASPAFRVAHPQKADRRRAESHRMAPNSFRPGRSLSTLDRCAIEEFETANGPADYALCLAGQIVGIVEAKKLTLGPQNVLLQAERYSKGIRQPRLQAGDFGVPFLYSTNGEVIWYHDVRNKLSRSRQVAQSRPRTRK
jgi:type I restriction enzyme, R subunit